MAVTLHVNPTPPRRSASTPLPLRSAPLLYGLSLAAVLPPDAWLSPAHCILPTILPTPGPILDPTMLQTVIGRPAVEVGSGLIALRDVDRRLPGLSLALDLFRAGLDADSFLVHYKNATTQLAWLGPSHLATVLHDGVEAEMTTVDSVQAQA
jgi:hypothetical protein